MTKEDTLLLYKDLCGRTTYGTKVKYDDGIFTFDDFHCGIGILDPETSPKIFLSGCYYGDDIKPYLFPLSSMTEEQKEEYTFIVDYISPDDSETLAEGEFIYVDLITELLHFYHKHNLDYRGLIPKGLALDATGLNIY
jgi:hypothetical protein